MFALNEVARELEVPFHVAHNDINIEELHDEFLSMLETVRAQARAQRAGSPLSDNLHWLPLATSDGRRLASAAHQL